MGEGTQAGWQTLFDGVSFAGWGIKSAVHGWEVVDGTIHLANPQGGGGKKDLYTLEQFQDFTLELEFRITPGTNSGIFFRVADIDHPGDWRFTGFEMQIIDPEKHPDLVPKQRCGAIYDLVPASSDSSKPAGAWNHVRIVCKGPHLSVVLNEVTVAALDVRTCTEPNKSPDGASTKFPHAYAELPWRGNIGLQDHRGEVWFRNIRIRKL